jgi:hypothetical protein
VGHPGLPDLGTVDGTPMKYTHNTWAPTSPYKAAAAHIDHDRSTRENPEEPTCNYEITGHLHTKGRWHLSKMVDICEGNQRPSRLEEVSLFFVERAFGVLQSQFAILGTYFYLVKRRCGRC